MGQVLQLLSTPIHDCLWHPKICESLSPGKRAWREAHARRAHHVMSDLPERAEALFFEGNRLMQAGEAEAAEACYRQALSLVSEFSEVLSNLALLRERAGAFAEAEDCYRRAIATNPECVQNYLNLGVMLSNAKRFAEAEAVCQKALSLAPDSAPAWSNLGVLLARLKREDAAEQCYRTAMALDPGYANAHFNLAYILLRQERFEEGWECLEARDWYAMLSRYFTSPRWQGEPLDGHSIIIGLEAGHGDMIQFCRYASVLKTMGAARVAVVCHPALKTLFASLLGIDDVFSVHDDVPKSLWDFWTPPLSLPYYCHTRIDTIPAPIPYLAAEADKRARWNAVLPASGRRVGLVWKGSASFENDLDRSLSSLSVLAPLSTVPGVSFVSLQKGQGEDEARCPPAGFSMMALGEGLADFSETAAIIANLDLVISVDTAVAHLAGALGKPCWVLLPDYQTDWRWLSTRCDSPWYPGMRLFRQPAGGGWETVVAALAEALCSF